MEEQIKHIKHLGKALKQTIEAMDIQDKHNLYEYHYEDLTHLEDFIRPCKRCGKYYFPKLNGKNHQKFCGDACRYNTTLETAKKKKKLDYKYRQIDLLRKVIYEYRYRCQRDNIKWTLEEKITYERILVELTNLRQHKDEYNKRDFDKVINVLKSQYQKARFG